MAYGIIGAMDEEVAFLREKMTEVTEYIVANSTFYEGKLANKKVVLLKSGIGKVNAAMATTILMERFSPSVVINTGSAGGFSPNLSVGDIVISDEVVHHDVDATAFDYIHGQVPQMPATYRANKKLIEQAKAIMAKLAISYEVGLIATGDTFMNDERQIDAVKKLFPNMLAAEMEGAAIAQVCYQYDVPFIIIRALSDIAGKDSPLTFDQFLKTAAKNASEIILSYITSYE